MTESLLIIRGEKLVQFPGFSQLGFSHKGFSKCVSWMCSGNKSFGQTVPWHYIELGMILVKSEHHVLTLGGSLCQSNVF